jgi:hypothetical protein
LPAIKAEMRASRSSKRMQKLVDQHLADGGVLPIPRLARVNRYNGFNIAYSDHTHTAFSPVRRGVL